MDKGTAQSRYNDLKQMLEQRRVDIQRDVRGRIQSVRGSGTTNARRIESGGLETAPHEDVELDLIQIQSELIEKITDAIGRLNGGDYGTCRECGEDIAAKRLRALPFATRCVDCQEACDAAARRARQLGRQAAPFSSGDFFFSDDR